MVIDHSIGHSSDVDIFPNRKRIKFKRKPAGHDRALFSPPRRNYNTIQIRLTVVFHLICHELPGVSRRAPIDWNFVPHHSSISLSSSRLYYIDRLSISRGLCNCAVKRIKAARSSLPVEFPIPPRCADDVLIALAEAERPSASAYGCVYTTHCSRYLWLYSYTRRRSGSRLGMQFDVGGNK